MWQTLVQVTSEIVVHGMNRYHRGVILDLLRKAIC